MIDGNGVKHDNGKPDLSLIPGEALWEIAKVLAVGEQEYGAHNWRRGMLWRRVAGASLRHLTAWLWGQRTDPVTGLSHLAHAACNLLFLITYERDPYYHCFDNCYKPKAVTREDEQNVTRSEVFTAVCNCKSADSCECGCERF